MPTPSTPHLHKARAMKGIQERKYGNYSMKLILKLKHCFVEVSCTVTKAGRAKLCRVVTNASHLLCTCSRNKVHLARFGRFQSQTGSNFEGFGKFILLKSCLCCIFAHQLLCFCIILFSTSCFFSFFWFSFISRTGSAGL